MISQCNVLNSVNFPTFLGERHYMVKFLKEEGLPKHLERFQDTVDDMLLNIDTKYKGKSQPIFFTVDEQFVKKGKTHRRGGVHIDGYWNEDLRCWGNSGGWGSIPNNGWGTSGWKFKDGFITPESIVLASSQSACKGYIGEYEGDIGEGGDCSNIDLSVLDSFMLEKNKVYRGNVMFLHESVPVSEDIERTIVRLNIKNI